MVTKHQEVTAQPPRAARHRQALRGRDKRSKFNLRLNKRLNSVNVIHQNNKMRQRRGVESRGAAERRGKISHDGAVARFRPKPRCCRSYLVSRASRMLVVTIGCCLPELHSNEPEVGGCQHA